jgi:dTDP-4-dehydrorhamnose reductase
MVEPRRVVVVGKSGQVGRSLCDALKAAGHIVIGLGRPDIDLCRPKSITDAIAQSRPDLVVNAAAYTAVDKAESEPGLAFAINAAGPETVAKSAEAAAVPIIHFSTDYVFDGSNTCPYVETDTTAPLGVYGRTKLEGDHRVARANPKHVILRTAWVCSPFGSNFVKTMLRLATERSELRVVNDQTGSPTFAADLALLVRQLVPHILNPAASESSFGVFHAVNEGTATWFEFARAIMAGAALRGGPYVPVHPIDSTAYPTKARRPTHSVLSTSKLHSVYRVRLQHWESALSQCLDTLLPINTETDS